MRFARAPTRSGETGPRSRNTGISRTTRFSFSTTTFRTLWTVSCLHRVTLSELDPSGVLPDRVYTKQELLDYLEHGRRKLRRVVDGMTPERAGEPRRFGPNEGPLFESL